ncbi:MAG: hypothetical protein ACPG20_03710, partial [Pontimonas sp.]
MTSPDIGQLAPDFTLPGITMVEGDPVKAHFTLSERRGHPVVLALSLIAICASSHAADDSVEEPTAVEVHAGF